jgi:peptidylprolyl isomerase
MKRYAVLAGVLIFMAALVMGCGGGNGAAVGDRVTVNYTGKLDDGTIFASSEGGEPLTFVIGDGTVIPGFDKAVRGMGVGERKTVIIPAKEAYGEYRKDLVVVLPRDEFAADLEVGDKIPLPNLTSGETIYFTIVKITDTEITLDANNPLAGKDLTFEIEIVAIEKAGS